MKERTFGGNVAPLEQKNRILVGILNELITYKHGIHANSTEGLRATLKLVMLHTWM